MVYGDRLSGWVSLAWILPSRPKLCHGTAMRTVIGFSGWVSLEEYYWDSRCHPYHGFCHRALNSATVQRWNQFSLENAVGIHAVAGVEPQHGATHHTCDLITCLSGVHFLTDDTSYDISTLQDLSRGWITLPPSKAYGGSEACPSVRFLPSDGYYYTVSGGNTIPLMRSKDLLVWEKASGPSAPFIQASAGDVQTASSVMARCAFSTEMYTREWHCFPRLPASCPLEEGRRVTNGIPLGWQLFLPVHSVNCVQTRKVRFRARV
jgi:hypothetical protein